MVFEYACSMLLFVLHVPTYDFQTAGKWGPADRNRTRAPMALQESAKHRALTAPVAMLTSFAAKCEHLRRSMAQGGSYMEATKPAGGAQPGRPWTARSGDSYVRVGYLLGGRLRQRADHKSRRQIATCNTIREPLLRSPRCKHIELSGWQKDRSPPEKGAIRIKESKPA